jgi:hypothetical protein
VGDSGKVKMGSDPFDKTTATAFDSLFAAADS